MTVVGVVCPAMTSQVCPGIKPNVVPFAEVPAPPTGLTNRVEVAVIGFVAVDRLKISFKNQKITFI